MKERILLKNINVFDVNEGKFKRNLDILIENDIIEEVGKVSNVDEASLSQTDCSEKFAVP